MEIEVSEEAYKILEQKVELYKYGPFRCLKTPDDVVKAKILPYYYEEEMKCGQLP